ncbi:SEC-C domain-containing protein [Patescibacteria group bacterium]|nr:SEC-C domain-containing protein [Patescibacteria group bacterium]MBU4346927.1 SEC-C domain-containing protein [Patescibacteria group bacterium]MBU4455657.1 SEC-C domain-containing protein [Patescibacteria group bacterium]
MCGSGKKYKKCCGE